MGDLHLETSRGRLLMSLPAAIPLAACGETGAVETVGVSERDSEYARAEKSSFDLGTIAAVGFAALITAGAGLIARMALRRRSFFEARHAALQGTADSLNINEAAKEAVTRFYELEKETDTPLEDALRALVRDTAIALQSDFRAQGDAGRIGPSLFLHDYWSESGDASRRRSMESAVALAFMPVGSRLLRASRIHSRIAEQLPIADGPHVGESIFVKTIHEIAAVQLIYRHAMSIKSETPHVKALNKAYDLILGALATIDTLRSSWALAEGKPGNERPEPVKASREDDETTDVDPLDQKAIEDAQKASVKNRLQRIRLISDPAEKLEKNIRQALRTMRERDYWNTTGGDESGSGSISYIRRSVPEIPADDPGGPDNAAMVSLRTLCPALQLPGAAAAAVFPMPLLAARAGIR